MVESSRGDSASWDEHVGLGLITRSGSSSAFAFSTKEAGEQAKVAFVGNVKVSLS
ncbi:hypothetical protein CCACVL1_28291 [Corchorus capsularis]|uniref:Uncharacterized protein n=1 Tax=Corchorus capsularis TaxID=210143 RepID=A0A1R3G6X9_COCAP|nr:hypothetical protein CCACVL1_28291 [Corchorus capsularis]